MSIPCPTPFLSSNESEMLFDHLLSAGPWEQHIMMIAGRAVPVPRLIAYYGPVPYRYTGGNHPARNLTPILMDLASRVGEHACEPFNAVLLNLYRSGRDSVGWHSDDDYCHDGRSAVASLSLGTARTFAIRHKSGKGGAKLTLHDGDLLVMPRGFQDQWEHSVPKDPSISARINLTFRWMS